MNSPEDFNNYHVDSKNCCYACIYVCFVSNIYKLHVDYDCHFLSSYQPLLSLIARISSLTWYPIVFLFSICHSKTTFASSFERI